MEGESGITRSFIDDPHTWDIEGGDQTEGETEVKGSVIDEFRSSDIQGD